jgi:copper(I)-binding protein
MNYISMHRIAVVAAGLLAAGVAAADAPTAVSAWARATPPGADVAAVYVTIGGVAKMRPVDGIEIPAGKTVTLAPQGHHLMLMGIDKPFVSGEHFPLTLHFDRGGDRVIDVEVRPATAAAESAPRTQP